MYQWQPADSLPKLMQSLEQFGKLSGYKMNIGKTQLLSHNYSPPEENGRLYPLAWQGMHHYAKMQLFSYKKEKT